MRKTIGILILMLSGFMSYGQNLMTIREVFDFEVGDKFHTEITSNSIGSGPNGADRITVIQKSFSINQDTLTYTLLNDNYSICCYPIVYFFGIYTDTLVLTNLDSLISKYDTNFLSANSISIYASSYCNTLTNSWRKDSQGGNVDIKTYGRGLGMVYEDHSIMYGHGYTYHKLVYYSKSGVECGTPDTTGVGIEDPPVKPKGITLFPNPVSSTLHITSDDTINGIELINQAGQLIRTYDYPSGKDEVEINVADIASGLYFLRIKTGNQWEYRKIVREEPHR
jgi:hypothetical protein